MILVRDALGEVLRRHRTQQGRTLRDVADAARVSLGYLSEIERGQKEPSSELLFAVCDALGVPLSEVLAETGEHVRAKEGALARREEPAAARPQRIVLGRLARASSGPSSGLASSALQRPGAGQASARVSLRRAQDGRARPVRGGEQARQRVRLPVVDLVSMPLPVSIPLPVSMPLGVSMPLPVSLPLPGSMSPPVPGVPAPLLGADDLVLRSLESRLAAVDGDAPAAGREFAHAAA